MADPGENIWAWSTVAADNGASDSAINWAEGQPRASVNNSARSMLAAHAKELNLRKGSIVTSGTPDAQTFASGYTPLFTTVPTGFRVLLKIGLGLSNTGPATLSMDGIAATAIKNSRGTELATSDLIENSYREFLWSGTEWILLDTSSTTTVLITEITIETVTPVAVVDFITGIDDTFLEYRFILTAIVPATNMTRLRLRVSLDAGVTWKSTADNYRGIRSDTYSDSGFPPNYGQEFYRGHFAQTNLELSHQLSNNATRPLHGELVVMAPYLPSINPMRWSMASWDGTAMNFSEGAGVYFGNGPVNGIRFMMETGNIASGSVAMYGVGRRAP